MRLTSRRWLLAAALAAGLYVPGRCVHGSDGAGRETRFPTLKRYATLRVSLCSVQPRLLSTIPMTSEAVDTYLQSKLPQVCLSATDAGVTDALLDLLEKTEYRPSKSPLSLDYRFRLVIDDQDGERLRMYFTTDGRFLLDGTTIEPRMRGRAWMRNVWRTTSALDDYHRP